MQVRLTSCSQGVGDANERRGTPCVQARPSDRTSRRLCTTACTTAADETRGRAYHVANLQPSSLRDSSGVHGENRPAFNRYKCSNWYITECLKYLFPSTWRKRVGVEPKLHTSISRRFNTLLLPPSSNWSQLESVPCRPSY